MRMIQRQARAVPNQGTVAEQLYRKPGYHEAGVIPLYVRNAAGAFEGTVVFYKALERIGAW